MTTDEVVLAGLHALRWEQERRRAEHEAAALAHEQEQEHLAEVYEVQEDLHATV